MHIHCTRVKPLHLFMPSREKEKCPKGPIQTRRHSPYLALILKEPMREKRKIPHSSFHPHESAL